MLQSEPTHTHIATCTHRGITYTVGIILKDTVAARFANKRDTQARQAVLVTVRNALCRLHPGEVNKYSRLLVDNLAIEPAVRDPEAVLV